MSENNEYTLKPTEKLDILYQLFNEQNLSDFVDKLGNNAVVGMQNFMWETAAEFGIICRGKNFTRNDITRKMTQSVKYQQQQGCTEPLFNCKGTECLDLNPACARKKIKEQINIMADSIREYIRIERKREQS